MNTFKLSVFCLIFGYLSYGQTNIYSEKDILNTQRIITAKVIYALENNDTKSIFKYLKKDIKNLESKLKQSILEIGKYKQLTTLSDVIIFDEESHIFRCRYSDKNRPRFQIDLYFLANNINSKIIKLIIKDDTILKMEYETRMTNSDIPPAPAPSKND